MALWVVAVICHWHLGVIHWYRAHLSEEAGVLSGGRALHQPAGSYWVPWLTLGLSYPEAVSEI